MLKSFRKQFLAPPVSCFEVPNIRLFSVSYRDMDRKQKLQTMVKTLKKLDSNQKTHFVEMIDLLQSEMIKEKIPMEVKSKKGTLHTMNLRSDDQRTVKVFEKKLKGGLFLHIGLRKLNFATNFMQRYTDQEMGEIMQLPEFQQMNEQMMVERFLPSYSLGENMVVSVSKIPLKTIVNSSMSSRVLEGNVLLIGGQVIHQPFVPQFQGVCPYTMLSADLKNREYCDLISDPTLFENMLIDQEVYSIEDFAPLEPQLTSNIDSFYQSCFTGIEIRWLHFQSLLWDIEDSFDQYESLKL